ncbi:MAG: T9SS type A sorting domain-containing protein, partial [Bacteroidota bacterium]
AYTLPVSFGGNNANPATPGANCHNGTDYDFYRIALAPGYTYTLRPRLHDAYNSNNGNTYTLDALFSYSTDGSTWSDAFDDVLSQPVQMNGGSQLFFKVSPYFTGQTGTYLLDIPITRSATTGMEEVAGGLRVYPNPGKDVFTIETPAAFQPEVFRVSDAGGRTVYEEKVRDASAQKLLKLSLPAGLYLLEAEGKTGKLSQKLILQP